jgi:hypothetical protein
MKKILLAVLIIILVLIGYFAYVQWNNIGAVVDGLRLDEEQLQQNTEAVKTEVNDYMKENQLEEIRELTVQEEKSLDQGTINDNDAVKIMTGKITLDELIETVALVHLKQYFGKITVLNHDGFYEPLKALLDHYVAAGMMTKETRGKVLFADTAEQLLEMLED